ncbi:hypothetical protein H8Z72_05625 [Xanthomonas citri pv. citri]|uniref:Phosphatidylserine/phosphatidylglycerophosphate/ cardiolipin synthase family protein n=1 Tax=Xanthomonas citri pv. durantae TaxID=487862 RepID=A0A9X6BFG9_XANCI|nr:phospholipase D family protein [Xanthomonas citri]OMG04975.1 hypothetical protein LN96_11385 [Xanthomonas citri pv. citri]PIB18529.1 hypothetical protein AA099_22810 [Xanthomonas citri pv. citri]PWF11724.1 hypothetical protein TP38_22875 [Xanthomonas citri pv. citri]QRD57470.1 hypothetical protein H8Z75_08670 [Xanthomonas citri pv. citri]QRD61212.1 hypothetical protein H8Z74_05640 [Xanthomonas citri pv. citri]
MDFVGQPLAGTLLRNAHTQSIEHCTRVLAAVAYGAFDQKWWFDDCLAKGKSLEFFGRYDGTVPIDPRLLEWALNPRLSANLSWRVVTKHLHAKVIWWEGQGVYIGSANMTDRAWNSNYEAGVFLPDDMLESFGLVPQLLKFFNGLRSKSEPLRQEHLDAQRALEKKRDKLMAEALRLEREFDANDPTVKHALSPLAFESKRLPDAALLRFLKEWNDTLQIMRKIAGVVSMPENRPDWIASDVPAGVQADQFLHAYYYRRVRASGEKDAYQSFYDRHHGNKEWALIDAVKWWKESDFDHDQEQRTIDVASKVIKDGFARDRILSLDEEEWVRTIIGVHAFGQHALHVSNAMIGLPPEQSIDAKTEALARWMWRQRTAGGKTPLEVIHHVVWGGPSGETVQRLWHACNSPKWRLGHMKTSILGELIGWVNPNEFPPRNRRTSKGLRSLGYDVSVDL